MSLMVKSKIEKYVELINHHNSSDLDAVLMIMKWLQEEPQENQPDVLKMVCETFFKRSDKSKKYIEIENKINRAEAIAFRCYYNNLINEMIKSTVMSVIYNYLSEEDFYKLILNTIINSPLFNTLEKKALALFYIIENELIPYDNIKFPYGIMDKDFDKIIIKNFKKIKKINTIISLPFTKTTEHSSLLLDEILNLETKEEQIVMMSVILQSYERNFEEKIIASQINNMMSNKAISDNRKITEDS